MKYFEATYFHNFDGDSVSELEQVSKKHVFTENRDVNEYTSPGVYPDRDSYMTGTCTISTQEFSQTLHVVADSKKSAKQLVDKYLQD